MKYNCVKSTLENNKLEYHIVVEDGNKVNRIPEIKTNKGWKDRVSCVCHNEYILILTAAFAEESVDGQFFEKSPTHLRMIIQSNHIEDHLKINDYLPHE